MDRRTFVAAAAAAPLAMPALARASGQAGATAAPKPLAPWVVPDAALPVKPLTAAQQRRVGVTTTGLRAYFPVRNGPVLDSSMAPRPESLSYLDAPAFVLEKTGLRSLEVWSMQFEDFGDDYLRDLRSRAQRAGVRLTNIQVDGISDNLGETDPVKRQAVLTAMTKWIDRAAVLGVPSLRFNTGGGFAPIAPDKVPYDQVVAGARQLADYGKRKKVLVLFENHIGYTSNIDALVEILKRTNNPNLRAIMDWGNGKGGAGDPLTERLKLLPWLHLISAKGGNFDDSFRMTDIDVAEYVRATESRGFRGLYSIELWGGRVPDPIKAIASLRDTIVANLSA